MELQQHVDSLITIPNEKLLSVLGKNTSLLDAFKAANDVLLGAVQGIADLIIRPGMINVDFADVRTVMSEMGMAMMGTGCGPRREPRARGGRGGDPQPAARGHQPAGRTRHPGEHHRGSRPLARRVRGGRRHRRGVRLRYGHRRGRHRDRSGNERRDQGHRGRHRPLAQRPVKLVRNATTGLADYGAMPNAAASVASSPARAKAEAGVGGDSMDYLDIPAFLRRQAD
jgi:cell division protein FtsZ